MSVKPPKNLMEWVAYLHAARAVPKDHPDYADAQEAVRFALRRIRTLNNVASAQDPDTQEPKKAVGTAAGVGLGLLHGLSLGAGEPIAGALAALIPGGQGFREGAEQYRQGVENIGVQQPTAFPAGDVGGLALQSLVPVAQAVKGGSAAAAGIPAGRAGVLARFFTGAGQADVKPALALGGLAGFSAGGEDPGDLNARLQAGAVGAGTSALGAAALGGLGALRVPRWLSGVKRQIRQTLPKGTPADMADGIAETAIRQTLARQGFDAPTQERILTAWRLGKTEVPPPPPPPTVRPGETITPIAPKGFAVTGARATPPIPTTPTILEMQQGRTRGVGGHSYTGTYPQGTPMPEGRAMPSPVNPGGQAMQLKQLQLLAQMPEQEFQSVAGLFPQEIIQQLQAIRAQFGLGR